MLSLCNALLFSSLLCLSRFDLSGWNPPKGKSEYEFDYDLCEACYKKGAYLERGIKPEDLYEEKGSTPIF